MDPTIFQRIADQAIEFIDLMYTDLLGGWHHVTLPACRFDERLCAQGVGVDGSSVTGFRKAKAGDMVLVPDLAATFRHPFAARPTLCVIGDLVDVGAREGFSRDPRHVARKAERYLAGERAGEVSLWLPELEFYLFDSVRVSGRPGHSGYHITSREAAGISGQASVPEHASQRRGYHAAAPEDRFTDIRSDMCAALAEIGIPVKYHHHEVGPAGQVEIELNFMPLVQAADGVALAKWVIRNLADRQGLVATFMPKPLYGEAGSGLHFHQYLAQESISAFYDSTGSGPLSEVGRFYVGGLLAHGRALSAFANASTNSYKRLVPGFEAPVRLAYSVGNRTAAIRVPGYANTPHNVRIEFRPPDATCNSHLIVAAMLMAGLDGIRRRLDPGGPLAQDLYKLPPEALAAIPALPQSLAEALDALEHDHQFLLEGGVFTDDLLEAWIMLKRSEDKDLAERPHPREFELYLGV
ncbi:MAG: type I glutamate--ammonia ligase [Acidobacteriota bacterium]